MHRDIHFIYEIYHKLGDELENENKFSSLSDCIELGKTEQNKKAECIAMYQGQKWKSRQFQKGNRVFGLQKSLKSLRYEVKNVISEKDQHIGKLIDAVDSTKLSNPKIKDHENQLSDVLKENELFHITQSDQIYHDRIAQLNRELPREDQAHETTVSFLQSSIDKYSITKEEWQVKYKKDTKIKEEEVNTWKERVERKKEQLSNLENKYEEYFKVVCEYEIQKEQERIEREKEEKEIDAATRIQAWWRGCLVRRGLKSNVKKKSKSQKK